MVTPERDVVIYHCFCGHVAPSQEHIVGSHIHTCQDQPSHHCILQASYGPCENCLRNIWNPLTGESLNRRTVEMESLKLEEDKYRLEVSERNEPLEESLCNLPAGLLSVPQARQLHNLLYQLERILIVTLYSPLMARRQERLQMAICRMPFQLVQELSLEERLIHLEVLEECYETVVLNYELSSIEIQDRLLEKAIELEQTIDPQINSLYEIWGPNAEGHPELSTRWDDLQRSFFDHQERFNFPVTDGSDDDIGGDWEYYIDDGDVEKAARLAAVSALVRSGLVEVTPEIEPICPICREKYGVSYYDKKLESPTTLTCEHVFGSDCITRWLCEHNTCPSCRHDYGGVL